MMAIFRKTATAYLQIFGLVCLAFFLLISYSHATSFFCPNGEEYEQYLNELLNDNDFIFSGTIGNITDDGRLILIKIKSLFKGVWKNPDITLLANKPFESSSSSIPLLNMKKDASRRSQPRRAQVGCFAYGPTELRRRDSKVFFARTYGFSVLLVTHIQLTRFILMKLRNLTLIMDPNQIMQSRTCLVTIRGSICASFLSLHGSVPWLSFQIISILALPFTEVYRFDTE